WTQQIRLPITSRGLEGVRPRHLPLLEHRLPGCRGDIEAVVRDDAPVVHRVRGGVAQRDEPRLPPERRRSETGDELDRRFGEVERIHEVGAQRADLVAADDPREPADTNGYRMDSAPADPGDDRVAGALQPKATLHGRPVLLRQVESARVAEQIRQMEQIDMQGVALDPFP